MYERKEEKHAEEMKANELWVAKTSRRHEELSRNQRVMHYNCEVARKNCLSTYEALVAKPPEPSKYDLAKLSTKFSTSLRCFRARISSLF